MNVYRAAILLGGEWYDQKQVWERTCWPLPDTMFCPCEMLMREWNKFVEECDEDGCAGSKAKGRPVVSSTSLNRECVHVISNRKNFWISATGFFFFCFVDYANVMCIIRYFTYTFKLLQFVVYLYTWHYLLLFFCRPKGASLSYKVARGKKSGQLLDEDIMFRGWKKCNPLCWRCEGAIWVVLWEVVLRNDPPIYFEQDASFQLRFDSTRHELGQTWMQNLNSYFEYPSAACRD